MCIPVALRTGDSFSPIELIGDLILNSGVLDELKMLLSLGLIGLFTGTLAGI